LVIAETSVFTRQIQTLLDEESYRLLQLELVATPEKGDLIKGSGGLRKLRWASFGKGKRGGVRVIYYWAREEELILMLLAYAKSAQEDLTPVQVRTLRRLVEEEFR
jgi:mRNA-degrading endonuclease RelE of RelBE toxin-antitoxin system